MFIYEKGYQSTDTAVSSIFTKMKGVGYTNVNGTERVWDVADYVFPPQVGVVSVRFEGGGHGQIQYIYYFILCGLQK